MSKTFEPSAVETAAVAWETRTDGQHRRARDGVRYVIFLDDTLERDAEVLLGDEGHADEQPERRERVDREAAGAAQWRVAVVEDHCRLLGHFCHPARSSGVSLPLDQCVRAPTRGRGLYVKRSSLCTA